MHKTAPWSADASTRISRRSAEVRLSACLESGTPVPATSVEVARLDLLFQSDRPLRFGTPLKLALYSEPVTNVVYTKAIVHYCRATPRGWRIGAFLTNPLPGRLTERCSEEMRSQLRYEIDWKAWVFWEREGRLTPVKISSYSINGLRLILESPVMAGEVFSMFGSAGGRDRAMIRGQVEWCRPSEHQFAAGCSLTGQRGRDLPRMFGNLTALHVDLTEGVSSLPGGESVEMMQSQYSEPEHFLAESPDTVRLPDHSYV